MAGEHAYLRDQQITLTLPGQHRAFASGGSPAISGPWGSRAWSSPQSPVQAFTPQPPPSATQLPTNTIWHTPPQTLVARGAHIGAQGSGHGAPHVDAQPPLAVAVAEQALADPVMREAIKQQALVLGGHAADAAKHYGRKGLLAFQDYVQQGPQGVSVLCFAGGLATSILGAMSVCNFFGTVVDPFHYILNLYVFAFGLSTTIIEADTDRIGMLMSPFDRLAEPVTRAQAWLHEECRLLTRLRGRGFFYLYQGTLLVTQCVFCLFFVCGLYSVLMGGICILMSFGITPDFDRIAESAGLGVGGPPYTLVPGIEGSPTALYTDYMFLKAEHAWRQRKEQLPGKTCRELWALHKQATVGDCTECKPEGMFNGSAKEQWRLWNGLRGVPQEDAKAMFIERLRRDGMQV